MIVEEMQPLVTFDSFRNTRIMKASSQRSKQKNGKTFKVGLREMPRRKISSRRSTWLSETEHRNFIFKNSITGASFPKLRGRQFSKTAIVTSR